MRRTWAAPHVRANKWARATISKQWPRAPLKIDDLSGGDQIGKKRAQVVVVVAIVAVVAAAFAVLRNANQTQV